MEHKFKKKNIIGLLVSAILLVLVFYNINFKELLTTLKLFDKAVFFQIIPLYLICQFIRGIRWNYLLCHKKMKSPIESGAIFSVGTALNSFLPARAGDIWRAFFIGKNYDESKMKTFGSIILERIFDGLSVVFILLVAVFLYARQEWILQIAWTAFAVFFGGFLSLYIIFKLKKTDAICGLFERLFQWSKPLVKLIQRINHYMNSFITGFECLNSFKCSFVVLFTSILTWYIECYVTLLLLKSFGLGLGFSASLFVISFIALSAMIPSTSVFIGPYQVAYIAALGIFSIPKSSALAIALVHQVFIISLVTIISIVFFLFNRDRNKFDYSSEEL